MASVTPHLPNSYQRYLVSSHAQQLDRLISVVAATLGPVAKLIEQDGLSYSHVPISQLAEASDVVLHLKDLFARKECREFRLQHGLSQHKVFWTGTYLTLFVWAARCLWPDFNAESITQSEQRTILVALRQGLQDILTLLLNFKVYYRAVDDIDLEVCVPFLDAAIRRGTLHCLARDLDDSRCHLLDTSSHPQPSVRADDATRVLLASVRFAHAVLGARQWLSLDALQQLVESRVVEHAFALRLTLAERPWSWNAFDVDACLFGTLRRATQTLPSPRLQGIPTYGNDCLEIKVAPAGQRHPHLASPAERQSCDLLWRVLSHHAVQSYLGWWLVASLVALSPGSPDFGLPAGMLVSCRTCWQQQPEDPELRGLLSPLTSAAACWLYALLTQQCNGSGASAVTSPPSPPLPSPPPPLVTQSAPVTPPMPEPSFAPDPLPATMYGSTGTSVSGQLSGWGAPTSNNRPTTFPYSSHNVYDMLLPAASHCVDFVSAGGLGSHFAPGLALVLGALAEALQRMPRGFAQPRLPSFWQLLGRVLAMESGSLRSCVLRDLARPAGLGLRLLHLRSPSPPTSAGRASAVAGIGFGSGAGVGVGEGGAGGGGGWKRPVAAVGVGGVVAAAPARPWVSAKAPGTGTCLGAWVGEAEAARGLLRRASASSDIWPQLPTPRIIILHPQHHQHQHSQQQHQQHQQHQQRLQHQEQEKQQQKQVRLLQPRHHYAPAYSLRCALAGGLLPGLERTLRLIVNDDPISVGPTPSAATAASLNGGLAAVCVVVDLVLRRTGVWPALLAHAPPQQIGALILTMRKVTLLVSAGRTADGGHGGEVGGQVEWQSGAPGHHHHQPQQQQQQPQQKQKQHLGDPRVVWQLQMLALLELLAPVVMSPEAAAAAVGAAAAARFDAEGRYHTGADAEADAGPDTTEAELAAAMEEIAAAREMMLPQPSPWGSHRAKPPGSQHPSPPSSAPPLPSCSLALNWGLCGIATAAAAAACLAAQDADPEEGGPEGDPRKLDVGPTWSQVLRAGGCPASGSLARAQQERMAVLAVTQWLPPLLTRRVGQRLVPTPLAALAPHGACTVAWRWLLLLARQCLAARGRDTHAVWLSTLRRVLVVEQIAAVLRTACAAVEAGYDIAGGVAAEVAADAAADGGAGGGGDEDTAAAAAAVFVAAEVLPVVLDVLEVLVAAAPEVVAAALAHNRKARRAVAMAAELSSTTGSDAAPPQPRSLGGRKAHFAVQQVEKQEPQPQHKQQPPSRHWSAARRMEAANPPPALPAGWGPGLALDAPLVGLLEVLGRQGLGRCLGELARVTRREDHFSFQPVGLLGSGGGAVRALPYGWFVLPDGDTAVRELGFEVCVFADCGCLDGSTEATLMLRAHGSAGGVGGGGGGGFSVAGGGAGWGGGAEAEAVGGGGQRVGRHCSVACQLADGVAGRKVPPRQFQYRWGGEKEREGQEASRTSTSS